MTFAEIQEKIDLYQAVMDGCKDAESFTLLDAIQGKQPSKKYLERQRLIEKAGLHVGFFSNAEPLYIRAKKKRDLYKGWLEDKLLLQNGISIA